MSFKRPSPATMQWLWVLCVLFPLGVTVTVLSLKNHFGYLLMALGFQFLLFIYLIWVRAFSSFNNNTICTICNDTGITHGQHTKEYMEQYVKDHDGRNPHAPMVICECKTPSGRGPTNG